MSAQPAAGRGRGWRALYTGALALVAPLFWWSLARRAKREGGQWDVLGATRFGHYSSTTTPVAQTGPRPIWVHAVSLGETRAALPLLRALCAQGPVLLTHTTATAWAESARALAAERANGRLTLAWAPYDFPGAWRRFHAHFQPQAGVLIEREVWPNLVAEARRAGVPLALVSARLSARSAQRAGRLAGLLGPAYAGLQPVLAQAQADAERLQALGTPTPQVTGNLKFDLAVPEDARTRGQAWRAAWGRPTVVLASTRDGEEALLADAIARQDPHGAVLWVVVPRHAQRFDAVAGLLAERGVSLSRRSAAPPGQVPEVPAAGWLVGDSTGEMLTYLAAADVAIIGGGFAPLGGQNFLEACALGTPVVVGPHMRNFAAALDDALADGAVVQVADAAQAVAQALALLQAPEQRTALGAAGLAFMARHAGATQRTLAALQAAGLLASGGVQQLQGAEQLPQR